MVTSLFVKLRRKTTGPPPPLVLFSLTVLLTSFSVHARPQPLQLQLQSWQTLWLGTGGTTGGLTGGRTSGVTVGETGGTFRVGQVTQRLSSFELHASALRVIGPSVLLLRQGQERSKEVETGGESDERQASQVDTSQKVFADAVLQPEEHRVSTSPQLSKGFQTHTSEYFQASELAPLLSIIPSLRDGTEVPREALQKKNRFETQSPGQARGLLGSSIDRLSGFLESWTNIGHQKRAGGEVVGGNETFGVLTNEGSTAVQILFPTSGEAAGRTAFGLVGEGGGGREFPRFQDRDGMVGVPGRTRSKEVFLPWQQLHIEAGESKQGEGVWSKHRWGRRSLRDSSHVSSAHHTQALGGKVLTPSSTPCSTHPSSPSILPPHSPCPPSAFLDPSASPPSPLPPSPPPLSPPPPPPSPPPSPPHPLPPPPRSPLTPPISHPSTSLSLLFRPLLLTPSLALLLSTSSTPLPPTPPSLFPTPTSAPYLPPLIDSPYPPPSPPRRPARLHHPPHPHHPPRSHSSGLSGHHGALSHPHISHPHLYHPHHRCAPPPSVPVNHHRRRLFGIIMASISGHHGALSHPHISHPHLYHPHHRCAPPPSVPVNHHRRRLFGIIMASITGFWLLSLICLVICYALSLSMTMARSSRSSRTGSLPGSRSVTLGSEDLTAVPRYDMLDV
eukprot:TRINITY_DN830_c0_g7_i1.p1 TRINITY_DN830_c0_g7~~TRINITY_DN830_c0_g7_i1.p1  ORF type:complete len:672 (-),score=68.09 TRINITY_DN830_c0_g7_i1:141-2156(-)